MGHWRSNPPTQPGPSWPPLHCQEERPAPWLPPERRRASGRRARRSWLGFFGGSEFPGKALAPSTPLVPLVPLRRPGPLGLGLLLLLVLLVLLAPQTLPGPFASWAREPVVHPRPASLSQPGHGEASRTLTVPRRHWGHLKWQLQELAWGPWLSGTVNEPSQQGAPWRRQTRQAGGLACLKRERSMADGS